MLFPKKQNKNPPLIINTQGHTEKGISGDMKVLVKKLMSVLFFIFKLILLRYILKLCFHKYSRETKFLMFDLPYSIFDFMTTNLSGDRVLCLKSF